MICPLGSPVDNGAVILVAAALHRRCGLAGQILPSVSRPVLALCLGHLVSRHAVEVKVEKAVVGRLAGGTTSDAADALEKATIAVVCLGDGAGARVVERFAEGVVRVDDIEHLRKGLRKEAPNAAIDLLNTTRLRHHSYVRTQAQSRERLVPWPAGGATMQLASTEIRLGSSANTLECKEPLNSND